MTPPRAYVVVDPDPHPWAGRCDTLVVVVASGVEIRYALLDPKGIPTLIRAIADVHGSPVAAAAAGALAAACGGPGR